MEGWMMKGEEFILEETMKIAIPFYDCITGDFSAVNQEEAALLPTLLRLASTFNSVGEVDFA